MSRCQAGLTCITCLLPYGQEGPGRQELLEREAQELVELREELVKMED